MSSVFAHSGAGRWTIPDPAAGTVDADPVDVLTVLTSSPRPGVVVVRAVGEIDLLTADVWQRALEAACRAAATAGPSALLVVDMTAVRFLSASGLGALAELHARSAAASVTLRVVADGVRVRRPVELLGLARVFSLHRHLTAALAP